MIARTVPDLQGGSDPHLTRWALSCPETCKDANWRIPFM